MTILHIDEQAREVILHAQLLDGSASGARFRAAQELPLRSPVVFYHLKLGVGGRGAVRYCNWSSQGYEIGIEFCPGVDWRGPTLTDALHRLRLAIGHPVEEDVTKPSDIDF